MKNKNDDLQTARNFVAKHMRAMNTPSVEIDRKKEEISSTRKEKHKKDLRDTY